MSIKGTTGKRYELKYSHGLMAELKECEFELDYDFEKGEIRYEDWLSFIMILTNVRVDLVEKHCEEVR